MTDWAQLFDGILTDKEMKINEPMSRHTTYGIGGPADVFITPTTEEMLKAVLVRADEAGIPVTVIGGGSNSLVSDLGIRGVTICTNRLKAETKVEDEWIIAKGGIATGAVSRLAWQNGLTGFEFAVGLPGTLCGAVFMNANGYGRDMKRVVESVRAISRDGKEEHFYTWDDIHYGDSDSVFMHNGDIVVEVKLHLSKGDPDKIKAAMDDHQLSRRTKQPLDKRSAGTMFLRPPGYHVGPMIKDCDLMGFAIGDAEVSTKHPDFVVNNGKATCADVLAVLHEVQRRVKEKYGVYIPLDVRIFGEGVQQER
jgi:UDP-N-acetylmuramate dehydrogenase